jgi:hypothetical protein
MNLLGAGMDPYGQPLGNPDPNASAGYGDTLDPPAPPGSIDVPQPPYSMVGRPPMQPGTLPPAFADLGASLNGHLQGALYGLGGAALAAVFSGARLNGWGLVKGALAGVVVCYVASKRTQGPACTLLSAAGGYAAARWAKKR